MDHKHRQPWFRHDVKFVVTGGTGLLHKENHRCRQGRKFGSMMTTEQKKGTSIYCIGYMTRYTSTSRASHTRTAIFVTGWHLSTKSSHNSHYTSDKYPTMNHFVTEMCTYFCYKMMHWGIWDWCIVGVMLTISALRQTQIGPKSVQQPKQILVMISHKSSISSYHDQNKTEHNKPSVF